MEDIRPFLGKYEDCIKMIHDSINKQSSQDTKSKLCYESIMIITRIIQLVDQPYDKLGNIYFIDEINPEKITEYIIEINELPEEELFIYAYVCRSLQKRINRFYKELKDFNIKNIINIPFSNRAYPIPRNYEKKYINKIKIRASGPLKKIVGIGK